MNPRIAWGLFADGSSSEMVTRRTHIFLDAVETGGDLGEAGAIISDHVNELFRLKASYVQGFKTFEVNLYLMHLIVIILLTFVGGFINVFTSVTAGFAESTPSEYAGFLGLFDVPPQDVSLVTNTILLMITIADTLAVYFSESGLKIRYITTCASCSS